MEKSLVDFFPFGSVIMHIKFQSIIPYSFLVIARQDMAIFV